jgi:hypothetical protein
MTHPATAQAVTPAQSVTLLVSPLYQHITVLVPAGSKELSGSDKKPGGAPLPPLCQTELGQATAYKCRYNAIKTSVYLSLIGNSHCQPTLPTR